MKKLLMILCVLLATQQASAQWQFALKVLDDAMEGAEDAKVLIAMKESLKKLEKMEEKKDEMLTKAGWLLKFNAIGNLVNVVEDIACSLKDFESFTDLATQFSNESCKVSYNYDVIVAKLNFAQDLITEALGPRNITPADRIILMGHFLEKYKEANDLMIEGTKKLKQFVDYMEKSEEFHEDNLKTFDNINLR